MAVTTNVKYYSKNKQSIVNSAMHQKIQITQENKTGN